MFNKRWDEFLHASKERPDDIMLEIGAGGELVVAYFRVGLSALLLLIPIASFLFNDSAYEILSGFIGVGFALLISFYWLKLAKQENRPAWLTFATSSSDVSCVSLVLIILAYYNPPAGTNSLVAWCCYLLCILSTAMRNDIRVTLFAGCMACVQFVLIVFYVMVLRSNELFSIDYGTVHLSNSIQRLILLIIFTLATALIVYRMQNLVKISGSDGLTGLPNRMYLNRRVPQLIQQAKLNNQQLSFALIDLDHFKKINDDLGHQAGDAALCHVVKVMRSVLQKDEMLMRIGGEEFLFVTTNSSLDLFAHLERFREKVAQSYYSPGNGHTQRQITLSAGTAIYPVDGKDMSGLLRCADLRLSKAKVNGRNQVVTQG
jgi:two-component system cell cycle response regulator